MDARLIEGTFPLVPVQAASDMTVTSADYTASFDGVVPPRHHCLLELTVHLYRMGPHLSSGSDDASRNWRPPYLVEKGRVNCGDESITIFDRPSATDN